MSAKLKKISILAKISIGYFDIGDICIGQSLGIPPHLQNIYIYIYIYITVFLKIKFKRFILTPIFVSLFPRYLATPLLFGGALWKV